LEKLAMAVKDGLIADNEVFPAHTLAVRKADSCVVFRFGASAAHGLHLPLHVALWPLVDNQQTVTGIAAYAATGNSANTVLMDSRGDAATATVVSSELAHEVGVHICTAAILAACEDAGIEQNGAVLFHLGHYL
jgi:hypothetical protein